MKKITGKIIAAFSLALVLASCSEMFENRISKSNDVNLMSLANLVVPPVTIEKLEAPKQIFVSKAEYPDKIRITWSPVEYTTSYCIERAISKEKDANGNFIVPDESEFEVIPLASKVYSTTYEDVILTDPNYLNEEYEYQYFYRVCAENTRLKYETSEYTVSDGGYLLAPPTQVTASLGEYSDKIVVNWVKSKNAKSYDIYRSRNSDGSSAVKIGNVSGNLSSYSNVISSGDQGVDYYYTIQTVTATSSSVSSSIALGYGLQEGAPPKVNGVAVSDGRGTSVDSITISWTAAAGNDIHYAVYRTSSKDSSFTLLTKDIQTTTYKDTKSLKPNVYYYYSVQAFTGSGDNILKGPFSSSGSDAGVDKAAEGFILGAPQDIKVVKNARGCNILFTPALGSSDNINDSHLSTSYNNYFYRITWSDNQNGPFTEYPDEADSSLSVNSEGYYTVVLSEQHKFYKLITVNSAGITSAESNLCAPVPFAPKNLVVSKGAYITGITLDGSSGNDPDAKGYANENGIFPVQLKWDAPSENDADGGYFIYRSTKKDSGFKKINEEPVMTTSYIFADETAKAGIYYYYRILSLNSLKQGANYSNTDYGYGALTANQYMREYNKTVINSQKGLKLMHMADDMKKLGSETTSGKLSGTLSYDANEIIIPPGARILMHYTNYADYYANNGADTDTYYFFLNGDTNTKASMDASGTMDGTVICTGMYPGSVGYDGLKIKGGAAGGGTYAIKREGFSNTINIDWKIGEEGK